MERAFILFVFFLSTSVSTFAQESKVNSAIAAYDKEDYTSALEKLNAALRNPGTLNEEYLAKAYLYKGKTLMALYMKAATEQDSEGLITYEMAFADAIDCFVECAEYKLPQGDERSLRLEATTAHNYAFNMGIGYLQDKELDKALRFATCAEKSNMLFVKSDLYMVQNLQGKIHIAYGDSSKALACFQQELISYSANPPAKPDYTTAYTFYQLALLHRYYLQNINAALVDIENGLAFLEKEHQRESMLEPTREETYLQAKKDLEMQQLDLYTQAPEKRLEALKKFEAALQNDPNNAAVRIVYAALLETTDTDAAVAQYEQVLLVEPTNVNALYNLGALYTNRGSSYSNQILESEDDALVTQLRLKADEDYKKAYAIFQRALEVSPDDYFVIRALMQISIQLDREEDYVKYREMLKD